MGIKTHIIAGTPFVVDSKYTDLKPVGRGAFGFVCSAIDTETGETVAIKKIPKAFSNRESSKRTLRELKLLRYCIHENIMGICDLPTPMGRDNFTELYVITDYMDTDLHDVIYSKQPLSDDHFKMFVYQILRGLKYLHSANVLHRDLKPSNLLLKKNCDLKICDFGLARVMNENEDQEYFMTEYVVTRWYRPPELILSLCNYDKAIDIWSVGCIFAELIGRKPLFPGKNYIHQLHLITDVIGTPPEHTIGKIHNEKARSFIRSIQRKPPVPLSSIYPDANPEAIDLLDKMLKFEAEERITVEEALLHPYLSSLHDPDDEPIAPAPFKFDFEDKGKLSRDKYKDLVYEELKSFHRDRGIHPISPSPLSPKSPMHALSPFQGEEQLQSRSNSTGKFIRQRERYSPRNVGGPEDEATGVQGHAIRRSEKSQQRPQSGRTTGSSRHPYSQSARPSSARHRPSSTGPRGATSMSAWERERERQREKEKEKAREKILAEKAERERREEKEKRERVKREKEAQRRREQLALERVRQKQHERELQERARREKARIAQSMRQQPSYPGASSAPNSASNTPRGTDASPRYRIPSSATDRTSGTPGSKASVAAKPSSGWQPGRHTEARREARMKLKTSGGTTGSTTPSRTPGRSTSANNTPTRQRPTSAKRPQSATPSDRRGRGGGDESVNGHGNTDASPATGHKKSSMDDLNSLFAQWEQQYKQGPGDKKGPPPKRPSLEEIGVSPKSPASASASSTEDWRQQARELLGVKTQPESPRGRSSPRTKVEQPASPTPPSPKPPKPKSGSGNKTLPFASASTTGQPGRNRTSTDDLALSPDSGGDDDSVPSPTVGPDMVQAEVIGALARQQEKPFVEGSADDDGMAFDSPLSAALSAISPSSAAHGDDPTLIPINMPAYVARHHQQQQQAGTQRQAFKSTPKTEAWATTPPEHQPSKAHPQPPARSYTEEMVDDDHDDDSTDDDPQRARTAGNGIRPQHASSSSTTGGSVDRPTTAHEAPIPGRHSEARILRRQSSQDGLDGDKSKKVIPASSWMPGRHSEARLKAKQEQEQRQKEAERTRKSKKVKKKNFVPGRWTQARMKKREMKMEEQLTTVAQLDEEMASLGIVMGNGSKKKGKKAPPADFRF